MDGDNSGHGGRQPAEMLVFLPREKLVAELEERIRKLVEEGDARQSDRAA